ncbi:hypothetical protein BS78_05G043100 [Paspalum vaginatum]|nr:hypothetical protein BS78_05G043100 [Paspalum vaginatum]
MKYAHEITPTLSLPSTDEIRHPAGQPGPLSLPHALPAYNPTLPHNPNTHAAPRPPPHTLPQPPAQAAAAAATPAGHRCRLASRAVSAACQRRHFSRPPAQPSPAGGGAGREGQRWRTSAVDPASAAPERGEREAGPRLWSGLGEPRRAGAGVPEAGSREERAAPGLGGGGGGVRRSPGLVSRRPLFSARLLQRASPPADLAVPRHRLPTPPSSPAPPGLPHRWHPDRGPAPPAPPVSRAGGPASSASAPSTPAPIAGQVALTTKMQEHAGSVKSCVWHAADFADVELKEEIFAIRFGSVEIWWKPTSCSPLREKGNG